MNLGKNYKRGFTLAEAILALLIMALIVNLTIMAIKTARLSFKRSSSKSINPVFGNAKEALRIGMLFPEKYVALHSGTYAANYWGSISFF